MDAQKQMLEDMGKTLQTISLLAYLREARGVKDFQKEIVAPLRVTTEA